MNLRENIYSVVIAGGSGTRFWPLSREMSPKQLLRVFGSNSLISIAIDRMSAICAEKNIYIVANTKLNQEIKNHLISAENTFKNINYITEPEGRNTAPAIGLAAMVLHKKNKEAMLVVTPADLLIKNEKDLVEALEKGVGLAKKNYLVTIGLNPKRPDTGFGYIKSGKEIKDIEGAFEVEKFVEKPSLNLAREYLKSEDYFWNSGIFVFKASVYLSEVEKNMPGLSKALEELSSVPEDGLSLVEAQMIFGQAENTSIDYGILEKSNKVAVIPLNLEWSDVGSLTALGEFFEKDEHGNVKEGNVVSLDTEDSIVYSNDGRLVATLGLKDTIVVDTQDATLICAKDKAQNVKKIVEILKEKGADEYVNHKTVHRPWGSFTNLLEGPGYKIKIIMVHPGKRLSLQRHHHRTEHWVVIAGTAKVTKGEQELYIYTNESTYIPATVIHRLENPGLIPLLIIEVQNGQFLEEFDIERLEDDFERSIF